nr:PREDICTED: rho GTPase-activating protein 6 [Latimeria chalumnae]|eukprot:XP_014345281.1 PREDICTED: rho GTPase-activating protein 6 [Latimeria chalumnae]
MVDSVFFDRQLAYVGDFTWNSMSGRSVRLKPVPIQSLSELERVRLQEVAFYRLQQDYDLGCQITIPKDGQKRKKSLRRKLDSFGKEKNKDKEFVPQAFGVPLSQVIANDRAYKQRQDSQKEDQKDASDFVASILQFGTKRQNKELSSSNSSLSSTSETPNELTSPNTPEPAPRARRRGAMSVDSITDLDDSQSRLLEALQLSLPAEAQSKKQKERDKKLSLNPIYRLVPRLVDSCCQHLEKYGFQTVGIFRVGSSKKRVRQLREEFDRGVDVVLDEEHSVHDVAALLKEFLRDMPDPLLTKELYTAFINTLLLEPEEQLQSALQLLLYLLPPCNCDTLHRILQFLSTVASHAEDTLDKDGQEITGNKMTSLNLATIFGPNLLHKQKSTDKEFSVQSFARAEESTAIITVLQKMIENYETLFMEAEGQIHTEAECNETNVFPASLNVPSIHIDQRIPELMSSFSLGGRHSSTDSNKLSSGEVSPYDNNSPVLSDRLLLSRHEDISPSCEKLFKVPEQYTLVGHLKSKSRDSSPGPWTGKDVPDDHSSIWGTWHSTLKLGSKVHGITGSHGNIYESSFLQHGQCSLSQGNLTSDCSSTLPLDNGKPPARRTHTTMGLSMIKPHAPVTRVCSSSQVEGNSKQAQTSCDSIHMKPLPHSASSSVEDIPEQNSETGHFQNRPSTYSRQADINRNESRPPPPYPDPSKQNSKQPPQPTGSTVEHGLSRLHGSEENADFLETIALKGTNTDQPRLNPDCQTTVSCNQVNRAYSNQTDTQNNKNLAEQDWQEWQRERWQIWELLSADNADALPETLV